MTERAFLSVYTPNRTQPEDLEAITVQRHAIIEDAVERIGESATTGNKHHLLFVGPRGTGKTHLIALLVHRLGQDGGLSDRLRIAWLNEDETSTSLLELLRRVYEALSRRYPDEFALEAIEHIFDLNAEEAERALTGTLLEKLQDRTLLVLIENLDALFEGLDTAGQHTLRAFIQEHPVVSLVATAQRLVDDIAKRQSAFFGFFQTEHLKPLTANEARELLRKIAQLNGQTELVAFLSSANGLARVRALQHLSGGNHRIDIVLSQFITRDSIQALAGPFARMVDEMAPYYQERVRWLPAQQRKIVEFLCTQNRPSPVKQIARRLFATPQTVSSQLKDLREKRYVQAAQRGRESLYEIADPMMRICIGTRANWPDSQLPALVCFLVLWYEMREQQPDPPRDQDSTGGADQPFQASPQTPGGFARTQLDSHLAAVMAHMGAGRWNDAMTALRDGLRDGAYGDPASSTDPAEIIGVFFEGTLQPDARAERIRELTKVFREADAIAELGVALTCHLGTLWAQAARLPSPENLDSWATAWEEAGNDMEGFRLPLRIFRAGIDFLKTGGTDRMALLDLNQEERRLLDQLFELDSAS